MSADVDLADFDSSFFRFAVPPFFLHLSAKEFRDSLGAIQKLLLREAAVAIAVGSRDEPIGSLAKHFGDFFFG